MKKVAVLSKYKEKNDFWLNALSEKYEVIIYNKHSGENLLPNVGREGHTYMHYIVDNYDNLPDEILFSQYDPIDHFSSNKKIPFNEAMQSFLNRGMINFCGIRPTDFDYVVRRRLIDWKKFSKELYGKFEDKNVNELLACGATLNGVFKVSKNAILKNDISFYKKALEMLSRGLDPEEGYFFERMWKFMFLETGCKNQNYEHMKNKIFLFGTKERHGGESKIVRWKNFNYGHIKLSEDGTIRSNGNVSYYHHFNESHWLIKENFLYLLDSCGGLTSRYDLTQQGKALKGDRLTEHGEWKTNALKISPPFEWAES